MINDKVYYIQPKAYYHNISVDTIINRFIESNIGKRILNDFTNNEEKNNFSNFMYDWFDVNDEYSSKYFTNVETDIFVAQKLMYHIKEFFYLTQRKNKTRKRNIRLGRITRKNSL